MSNAIENIEILHYSPLVLSHLFVDFYEGLREMPKSFLLSYLVLPLVLHPESKKFLKNANAKSSLRTLVEDKSRIFGIDSRVRKFKSLSGKCMQYAVNLDELNISNDLTVVSKRSEETIKKDLSRAALRLGMLFSSHTVPAIYRNLGIKKI